MSTIEIQQIGTNRYAPAGANAVCLYGIDGADGLTLAQLVSAVCIRRCAHLEARAVGRMNKMTQNNTYMDAISSVCKQIAADAELNAAANIPDSYEMRKIERNCTIYQFLTLECGLDVTFANPLSYKQRMDVIATIKTAMDSANTTSQEDVIELQSMINWRDVTYNASGGIVSRYGNTEANIAGNI